MEEMTDEEEKRLKFVLNKIQDEIYSAMYNKPKCDFEHIYNQGLASADDILISWMPKGDELELNMDKINEVVFIPDKPKKKSKKKALPKAGIIRTCPKCQGRMEWVDLGGSEGSGYSCDDCDAFLDENLKEFKD